MGSVIKERREKRGEHREIRDSKEMQEWFVKPENLFQAWSPMRLSS